MLHIRPVRPGAEEDATGRPFVGKSGKLLDKLLGDIGLNRSDVWIGNVVKHRPPNNRDPLPAEIMACKPYITSQIDIIDPLLIVTLGRFAMNYFYPQGKISTDRGTLIKPNGRYVFPVYHPSAGFRNGKMMQGLKEDFAKIPECLNKIKLEIRYRKKLKELRKRDPFIYK